MISTEMLGIYTIAVSIFIVLATALNSGLPVTVSKMTAENFVDKKYRKIHAIVTSSLILSIIIGVCLVLILLISKNLFNIALNNDSTVYYLLITMIPAVLFTGVYAPFRGYLWGMENYLKVSVVEFVEQIIRIASCFILFLIVDKTNSIYAAGISLSIACVLSTILGIIFYYTSKGKIKYEKGNFVPVLKSSGAITGVRMASSLMQPIIAIILPIQLVVMAGFTQEQALSQLGIAMGMTMPILSIPSTIIGSLAMALIPKISSLVKEEKNTELVKQINSAIIFTLCCSFIVIPIFSAFGELICMLIFNNSLAGEYLSNASWLMITMGLSQLTTSILNSLGLEVKTFIYYIISSVFLIGSVLLLPGYVGIYALLYGLGISSLIVSILNIIKINKTIKNNNFYLKSLLHLIMITIPMIYLAKFSYNLMSKVFTPLYSLIVISGLTFIFYVALLVVAGLIDISFIKTRIRKQKKEKTVLSHKT